MYWTATYALSLTFGFSAGWNILAALGVWSGVWIGEEWPEPMDEPWRSSSLTELWGKKRFYQGLRVSRDSTLG